MGQEQSTAVGPLDWQSQGQSDDVGCCKKSLYCTFSPHWILAPKLTYIRFFFNLKRIFYCLEIPNMNITNSGINQF